MRLISEPLQQCLSQTAGNKESRVWMMGASFEGMKVGHHSITFDLDTQMSVMDLGTRPACKIGLQTNALDMFFSFTYLRVREVKAEKRKLME